MTDLSKDRQAGTEIEITDAMIEAGAKVFSSYLDFPSDNPTDAEKKITKEIFSAILSAA